MTGSNEKYEGVILAAGRGTRMAPFSDHFPKPLLPILNKPLIHHQIEYLRDLGVEKVFVVIGHLGHEIARQLGDGGDFGVEIVYVEQRDAAGIAHAVMQLEPLIHRTFAMLLGDIYFDVDRTVNPFECIRESKANGMLAVMRELNPARMRRNFAVHMDEDNFVQRVVEKPRHPRTEWKGCGLYVFDVSFFDAVRRTPRTAGRNEYEITDAVQIFLDDGARVVAREMVTDDINLTFPYDVLLANLHALRQGGEHNAISPSATVAADAKLDHCIVGEGARIGPGVSMSQTVVMPGAIVTTREPVDRSVFLADRMLDCRHWVDGSGAAIDHDEG